MIHFPYDERIRRLYESRRSRTISSSLGNSKASCRTQGRGREESSSAWAETKAASRTYFPRFKRPALKRFRWRRCWLTSDFRVGQTLPHDLRYCEIETVTIVHWTVLSSTIVETPRLLIQVAKQMERLDAHISSSDTALQEAPEVFESVGVNASVNVAFGVVDNLVCEGWPQVLVGHERIGVDRAAFLDVSPNLTVERVLGAIRNDSSANLSECRVREPCRQRQWTPSDSVAAERAYCELFRQ